MESCPYFIKWFVSKPTWQAYKRLEVDNHSCSQGWTKIRVKENKKILLPTMKTLCWFSLTDSWTLSITYHIFRVAFIKGVKNQWSYLVSMLALYVYEVFEAKKFSMVEVTQSTWKCYIFQVIAFFLIRWIKIHRPLWPGTIKWLSPWRQSSLKTRVRKSENF